MNTVAQKRTIETIEITQALENTMGNTGVVLAFIMQKSFTNKEGA